MTTNVSTNEDKEDVTRFDLLHYDPESKAFYPSVETQENYQLAYVANKVLAVVRMESSADFKGFKRSLGVVKMR